MDVNTARKGLMSDAEVMSILVYFHFNTFRNFKHYYLFFVKTHLADLFPNQLSYNRFVEVESRLSVQMMLFLQLFCFERVYGHQFLSTAPVFRCAITSAFTITKSSMAMLREARAPWGGITVSSLHLICNERGELLNFVLTRANVDDRNTDVLTG